MMKTQTPLLERVREDLFQIVETTMEKDGVSQSELARRIGAQRPNINKIMTKANPVRVDYLLKMIEGLGLDLDIKIKRIK